jgi:hypothetical protein
MEVKGGSEIISSALNIKGPSDNPYFIRGGRAQGRAYCAPAIGQRAAATGAAGDGGRERSWKYHGNIEWYGAIDNSSHSSKGRATAFRENGTRNLEATHPEESRRPLSNNEPRVFVAQGNTREHPCAPLRS